MVSRMDMACIAARYDTTMAAAFRRALGIESAAVRWGAALRRLGSAFDAALRRLGSAFEREFERETHALEGLGDAMRNADDPESWHWARTHGR